MQSHPIRHDFLTVALDNLIIGVGSQEGSCRKEEEGKVIGVVLQLTTMRMDLDDYLIGISISTSLL